MCWVVPKPELEKPRLSLYQSFTYWPKHLAMALEKFAH